MVGLSHPNYARKRTGDVIKYSQRFVDVIDLEENPSKQFQ
jgi:hypothetical protein